MPSPQDSDVVVTAGSYTANVKTFLVTDVNGNLVQIQGVTLLAVDGSPVTPLGDDTGKAILQALLQLDQKLSIFIGQLPNSNTQGLPQS